ncbi:hypothetical protein [Teredinibacter sp. KSP-S5-2]|uniref:hypothetical protein n=1 Tax=Teredinibacter sp. KSP-S5-2 TaxID=3034506 RepID=UPI00293517F5|nr:hypothetical protein [Teredinibacter sp. KSP-S5-2]WNO08335.1 hypothetical protein P5V12_15295 [Teredinibacter sp. KSP-S5-2]
MKKFIVASIFLLFASNSALADILSYPPGTYCSYFSADQKSKADVSVNYDLYGRFNCRFPAILSQYLYKVVIAYEPDVANEQFDCSINPTTLSVQEPSDGGSLYNPHYGTRYHSPRYQTDQKIIEFTRADKVSWLSIECNSRDSFKGTVKNVELHFIEEKPYNW